MYISRRSAHQSIQSIIKRTREANESWGTSAGYGRVCEPKPVVYVRVMWTSEELNDARPAVCLGTVTRKLVGRNDTLET